MKIRIITVGSKSQQPVSELIESYTKRLPKNVAIEWIYIKHGDGNQAISIEQEAERILSVLPKQSCVVLLDETGSLYSSPEISNILFSSGGDIAIIIGGAYGVSEKIKNRSKYIWALSKLVFPHQLVRLILAEQLYRSHTIMIGHPYHHE